MRAVAAIAGLGLASALVAGVSPAAEAHTPWAGATCAGVTVSAVNYDPRAVNTWSVTVEGVTRTGTFGSSFVSAPGQFPVPQGGATSAWAVKIDAPGMQYDLAAIGVVGPCGQLPPPPPPPQPPVVPPAPPVPTGPPVVPPVPPAPRHARVRVDVVDRCNCYRDSVEMRGGRHVTIRASRPSRLTWRFFVRADEGYLLPSRIGGHSGWAETQTYLVHTTNVACPCHERGDCPVGYHPPSTPCRGREC